MQAATWQKNFSGHKKLKIQDIHDEIPPRFSEYIRLFQDVGWKALNFRTSGRPKYGCQLTGLFQQLPQYIVIMFTVLWFACSISTWLIDAQSVNIRYLLPINNCNKITDTFIMHTQILHCGYCVGVVYWLKSKPTGTANWHLRCCSGQLSAPESGPYAKGGFGGGTKTPQ